MVCDYFLIYLTWVIGYDSKNTSSLFKIFQCVGPENRTMLAALYLEIAKNIYIVEKK